MIEELKCWYISFFSPSEGMGAKIFALSRGRARYKAALALREVGYVRTIGEAFKQMRCRRAPEFDDEDKE